MSDSNPLDGLTAEQAAAVARLAGDSVDEQRRLVALFRPTWAPAIDHRAIYEAMREANPVRAAQYAAIFQHQIWR